MELSEKGKRFLISTIIVLFIIKIILAISDLNIEISSGREFTFRLMLVVEIVNFIFTSLLLLFIYKGYKWAKWLLAIFLILGGALYLLSFLKDGYIIRLLKGISYLAIGIIFIVPKSIREFMKIQKELAVSKLQLESKIQIKFTKLSILSLILSIIPYILFVIAIGGNINKVFIAYLNITISFLAIIFAFIDLILKDRKRLLSMLTLIFGSLYFLIILGTFAIAAVIYST